MFQEGKGVWKDLSVSKKEYYFLSELFRLYHIFYNDVTSLQSGMIVEQLRHLVDIDVCQF